MGDLIAMLSQASHKLSDFVILLPAFFILLFSFEKEHFLRIVDILKPDFPSGRGAISPVQRVGLFLSYCAGKDMQVLP